MHILIAPDSFKESLSAAQVAQSLQTDFLRPCQMPALICFRSVTGRGVNGCAEQPWARLTFTFTL